MAAPSRTVSRPLPIPATVLAAGAAAIYFAYAWARWTTLKSSAFDLAYFDQVVWNASRGHGFSSSFAQYPFFGQHFSPALAALVPLYAIHPSPLWLLAAQSIALGAAMAPLFMLARTWLDATSAAIACVSFGVQLFVIRAVNYDFHTEVLAIPFVFWAVLGAVRSSRAGDFALVLAGIAPMLCKEDGALVSLGIGFLGWAIFRRRAGLVLMALALAYGLLITIAVMPAIRGGRPGDLIGRYDYLGSSVPGILLGLVQRPDLAVHHLLSPGPLLAVALLLGGIALLPLARPVAAVAAVPALVFALLSQKWQQETLLDQYGVQAGPLIFVAALLGWARLRPLIPKISRAHGAHVLRGALAISAVATLALGAPELGLGSWDAGHDAQSLAGLLPPNASVDASSGLLPLLAERDSIGVLPAYQREWVAIDASTTDAVILSRLPGDGYTMAGSWGRLSLWHRTNGAPN
ncbi:MAG: hypothetical protein NVS9B11_09600 [Candidatus Dormibacteraceae bacterium]